MTTQTWQTTDPRTSPIHTSTQTSRPDLQCIYRQAPTKSTQKSRITFSPAGRALLRLFPDPVKWHRMTSGALALTLSGFCSWPLEGRPWCVDG